MKNVKYALSTNLLSNFMMNSGKKKPSRLQIELECEKLMALWRSSQL